MKNLIVIFLITICAPCASQPPKKETNIQYCYSVNECAKTISTRIQIHFITPLGSKNIRAPLLNFSLNKNGDLITYKIIKSSGDKNYDQTAIIALRKAAPFPEIQGLKSPKILRMQNINLRIKPYLTKKNL